MNEKAKLYSDIEEDPRFRIATKESKICWAVAWTAEALQLVFAFVFGYGDGTDLIYFCGLPLWLVLGLFITPLVSIIVMNWIVRHKFADFPLDAYLDEETLKKIEEDAK